MNDKKVDLALRKTIIDTFTTLFSETPVLSEATGDMKAAEDTLVASIGLAGLWNGSLVIVAPLSAVRILVSKMLGSEVSSDQDLVDGIGELLNIFAGSLKSLLREAFGNFEISLPAVIMGIRDAEIARMKKTKSVAIGVELDGAYLETYFFYSEQNEYSVNDLSSLASEQGAEAAADMLKKMYQAREKK